jgi:hypothetical protein
MEGVLVSGLTLGFSVGLGVGFAVGIEVSGLVEGVWLGKDVIGEFVGILVGTNVPKHSSSQFKTRSFSISDMITHSVTNEKCGAGRVLIVVISSLENFHNPVSVSSNENTNH